MLDQTKTFELLLRIVLAVCGVGAAVVAYHSTELRMVAATITFCFFYLSLSGLKKRNV